MIKRLALILLLGTCAATVRAQTAAFNGFCQIGGKFVSTTGLNSTTKVQASYPQCTVTVYQTGTTNRSTLFSNATSSPLANPFQANVDGSFLFFASTTGCYDVVTSVSTSGGTPPMPTPFTYTDVCLGGGGGGGVTISGTPYQVSRFNAAGNNVTDSSGSDNPANGPTQWVNGLSVMANGLAKLGVNSPNGTTVNLLACADPTVTAMTQFTTCPAGTNKAKGVVDTGAGTTGNVQIYDHAYHACVFDNQTAINDYAVPSAANPGQCSDAGGAKPNNVEILGTITTINSGNGTLATVDWFTGDTIAPGSGGGSGTVSTCAQANSNALFQFAGTVVACDIFVTDDSAGNMTMFSLGLTNPNYAGFYYQKQGPAPPATPANSVAEYPPTSVTAYAEKRPGTVGTAGQTRIISSVGTDGGGNPIAIESWGTAGGTSLETQTNSVDNLSQALLNLINQTTTPPLGMTLGPTNTSGGVVEYRLAAAQLSTPTTPTITPKGTTGATTYSYKIVAHQDTAGAYHTPASSAGTTSTGNATLSSTNYNLISGYQMRARCFDVYRTAGGATQGKIASCVPFQFKDTGLAGDGTTAPSTNTTQVFANPQPLPGCNIEFGSVVGVDSPPCTPQSVDDEAQSTSGAPGDANSMWVWQTQGTASAAYTGGVIKMATSATNTQLTCLTQPVGTAPYSYVAAVYVNADGTAAGGGAEEAGLAFFECVGAACVTSAKYEWLNLLSSQPTNPTRLQFGTWSSATSGDANQAFGPAGVGAFLYFKIQNDGTNLNYSWSADGITYTNLVSHAKNFTFTTQPTDWGICVDNNANSGHSADFDYMRKTQ